MSSLQRRRKLGNNEKMANIKREPDPQFEIFKAAVGERIRNLREINHLTQAELSEKTNINRTHISMIENGRKDINLSTLYRLANEFKLRPSNLMDVDL